jgi:hypothetical protein
LRLLAELTLAVVLFADAAKVDLAALRRSIDLPVRLLLVALPLIIALGMALGILVLEDLTLLEVALVATMLAPTDAALGSAVVSDRRVPVKIRQGLNVESGLNDGICVPIPQRGETGGRQPDTPNSPRGVTRQPLWRAPTTSVRAAPTSVPRRVRVEQTLVGSEGEARKRELLIRKTPSPETSDQNPTTVDGNGA